ncbi:MAG: phage tail tape measure protein [Rhizobiaceae bacterium]|nr:phage tail tape measure protein [Rhizobiaceae bacterium]
MAEEARFQIVADTEPLKRSLENLQDLSERFGSQLTSALRGAAVDGRELDAVLRRVALNLADMALQQGLQPLQTLAGGLFSRLFGAVAGAVPFARGGVVPFAGGGVVSAPTYFPLGGGAGLMGEAGAEAIMPLRRAPDGRLGVAAGGEAAPVNVVFNVTATDAASFRKSQAQVTGMLARAVSRGTRTL